MKTKTYNKTVTFSASDYKYSKKINPVTFEEIFNNNLIILLTKKIKA